MSIDAHNVPTALTTPTKDSSLLVDPAIVENFTTRHKISLEKMEGSSVDARRAAIRYMAEIDFRRQQTMSTEGTALERLHEELLDQMVGVVVHNYYVPPLNEGYFDVATGRYASISRSVLQDRVWNSLDMRLSSNAPSQLNRLTGLTDAVDRSTQDVPLHLLVPFPWNTRTITRMMGLDKNEIGDALDDYADQCNDTIRLSKLEGTDIYFVDAGNHRVLGRQWQGRETVTADIKTYAIDFENTRIDGKALEYISPDFNVRVGLTKVELKIADHLGIAQVGRDLYGR